MERPSDMPTSEQIKRNERELNASSEAARRQGRCGCCGRLLVGTGRAIFWRHNIYGEPTWPLCGDPKDCNAYTRWLAEQGVSAGRALNGVRWEEIGLS